MPLRLLARMPSRRGLRTGRDTFHMRRPALDDALSRGSPHR
ncbi:hypothetical protein OH687_23885 [Burkholderia anthina]|nr:hypothetical protein OH687_23885 [Burkholderia anthina]